MRWWMQDDTQEMLEDSQHVHELCLRWETGGSLDKRAVIGICAASGVSAQHFLSKHFLGDAPIPVSAFMADYCQLKLQAAGARQSALGSNGPGRDGEPEGLGGGREFEEWSKSLDYSLKLSFVEVEKMYNELKHNLGVGNSPGNGNTRLASAKASQGSSQTLVGSRVGGPGHGASLDRQDV
eukprot:INCI3227.1.p1 GENE.INCI3227.1~~INCI3227.1.p1  ORF type:complete len:181 (+),score=29.22 INCI3227.1:133-675(+)